MTNEEFLQSVALPGEEWRDVPGYEGIYAFSSKGRIASLRTEFYYNNRMLPRKVSRSLLKPTISMTTNGGYYTLTATVHKKTKILYIHRLVANAFVPNPNPSLFKEVDHIDGDPHNNSVENLRWTNRSGNMLNPITQKRQAQSHMGKTSKHRKAVVSISPTGSIKKYGSMRDTTKEGFSIVMVSQCCSGKCKTHKGLRWMLLSDYESQVSMSKNSAISPA